MPRYFFTEHAAQPFIVSGRTYQFTPVGVYGARLVGVLAAETDQAIADMLALVGRGTVEIPAAEYEAQKKTLKAPASSASLPSSERVAAPSALQSCSIQEKTGVLRAAGASPEPAADAPKPLRAPGELIVVGRITLVHPLVNANERIKKQSTIAA